VHVRGQNHKQDQHRSATALLMAEPPVHALSLVQAEPASEPTVCCRDRGKLTLRVVLVGHAYGGMIT
jgi:hypothetical protein